MIRIPTAWQQAKKAVIALHPECEIVYRSLRAAYAQAAAGLTLPPLPPGRLETVREYSGGQGWDGAHGDTADDGGDYVSRTYLYVTPTVFAAYMVAYRSWCVHLEALCASELSTADDYIRRADAAYRTAINLSMGDYWHPSRVTFRTGAWHWCVGEMYGPVLYDTPSGPRPFSRDGLRIKEAT